MANFLNNCLIQLFDIIEARSDIQLATFTAAQTENPQDTINASQDYIADYINSNTGTRYKYLYDPGLSFNFRFHQYLSDIQYVYKNQHWITLMFSTGVTRPLTNVISHSYQGHNYITRESDQVIDVFPYRTRRVLVPIQIALISNNMTYLYENLEKIALYFDRIVNFEYNQTIRYNKNQLLQWKVVGQCMDIQQTELTKLDTESRGSITTAGFSFDLVHWVTEAPEAPIGLLEKVILEVTLDGQDTPLFIHITE